MILADGTALHNGMRTKGSSKGLFYYLSGPEDKYDHSVSQYGVLGMWALCDAGYVAPEGFWQEADHACARSSCPTGPGVTSTTRPMEAILRRRQP